MKTKKDIEKELKRVEEAIEEAIESEYEYGTELEDVAIRDILRWVLEQ